MAKGFLRLIVAGTRSFHFGYYNLLKREILKRYADHAVAAQMEIVSGCCFGADSLGEIFGEEYNLTTKHFPADWRKYGKAAGPIRNKEMAKYADAAIVFWDGESKGSQNMIKTMREFGKPVDVVIYPKAEVSGNE